MCYNGVNISGLVMRRKKQRIIPMPTEEDKKRAQLKIASADPLVWAMKSVDDAFPDGRVKSEETIKAEAEVEMLEGSTGAELEDDLDDVYDDNLTAAPSEIQAEGKLTMPMGEGVMTMEVTPQRQSIDDAPEEEIMAKKSERLSEQAEVVEEKPAKKWFGFRKKASDDEVNEIAEYGARETEREVKVAGPAARDFVEPVGVNPVVRDAVAKDATTKDVADVKVAKGSIGKKLAGEEPAKLDHKTQVKLTALESKQKRMMIGFFAMLALGLGGVIFGVVAIVNQKNATSDLVSQIVSSTGVNENSVDGDYIYLKDWKMKIKMSGALTDVSFDYDNEEYPAVMIWGVRKDPSIDYTPDFAKQSKNTNPLGVVTRVPRYERAAAGRLIWYDDYYNYYYQGPTGIPSVSESEMNWWVESYLLIKEMLTNADNYTTIEETNTIGQQQ